MYHSIHASIDNPEPARLFREANSWSCDPEFDALDRPGMVVPFTEELFREPK